MTLLRPCQTKNKAQVGRATGPERRHHTGISAKNGVIGPERGPQRPVRPLSGSAGGRALP